MRIGGKLRTREVMLMEMTIDEIIDAFDYIKHVGNGEFEYKHCREGIALDEAAIILRKYEKIVQIMERTVDDGTSMYDTLQEIERGR